MCNLYSIYSTQEAMRRAFAVARDNASNVPPLPGIFPDQMALVVRMQDGERELLQMRWGFPSTTERRQPPKAKEDSGLVRSEQGSSPCRVRRHLAPLEGCQGDQGGARRGRTSPVLVS